MKLAQKKYAAIDVGSNSLILCIATFDEEHKIHVLYDESRITSLGRGIASQKKFDAQSMEESLTAFINFKKKCDEYGVDKNNIFACATEAARRAENVAIFFEKIYQLTQIKIEIISGEREAFLTCLGLTLSPEINLDKNKPFLNIDIGGASTEVSLFSPEQNKMISSFSFSFGVVLGRQWLDAGPEGGLILAKNVKERLEGGNQYLVIKRILDNGFSKIILSSGSALAVESVFKKHNIRCEFVAEFVKQLGNLNQHTNEDFERLYGDLLGKRAKTIKAGVEILLILLNYLCPHEEELRTSVLLSFSHFGLRHGMLWDKEVKGF